MRKIALIGISSAFLFSSARATSLDTLAKLVEQGKLSQVQKALSANPTDKLKVKILFLLSVGETERAKALLEKMQSEKSISNVLYLPKGLDAIVVEKSRQKLYLVSYNGTAPKVKLVLDCVTGKRPGDKMREGDERTPDGVYFPLYWKDNLPPRYGIGAFPLNYPNIIDRELLHKDGHGIWIHGSDRKRAPFSSNGCVVLKNADLKKLKLYIKPKITPVVIVENLSFEPVWKLNSQKNQLLAFIYDWKTAWEDSVKNINKYFSFYSKHFVSPLGNLKDWEAYKRRITKRKRWIKIKISEISLTRDGKIPGYGTLYVADFKLDYRSNNYNCKTRKVLYIINEGGKWKILGEETL